MPSLLVVGGLNLHAVLGLRVHSWSASGANILILVAPRLELLDSVKDTRRLKIDYVRLGVLTLREEHSFGLILLC